MTEQEWLTCTNPDDMLAFLCGNRSDRKLRLFACACCRLVWDRLPDLHFRRAVEVAEQYADGLVSSEKLDEVYETAGQAMTDLIGDVTDEEFDCIQGAVAAACRIGAIDLVAKQAAWGTSVQYRQRIGIERRAKAVREAQMAARTKQQTARAHQASLLRDIFGSLIFHPIAVDSSWLSWNDSIIPKLAQAIYHDRAFDRLPILADALEEAGCSNSDILNHCRQPGEHVLGCWVVDLLLGKS